MSKIKGIYAASVSILKDNLTLNIEKTSNHIENLIDEDVMELLYLEALVKRS